LCRVVSPSARRLASFCNTSARQALQALWGPQVRKDRPDLLAQQALKAQPVQPGPQAQILPFRGPPDLQAQPDLLAPRGRKVFKASPAQRVRPDLLGRRGTLDRRGQSGLQGPQGQLVPLGLRACRVFKASRGPQGLRGQLDLPARKVCRASLAQLVRQGLRARRAFKA
jgi:hypothetical protein